MKDLFKINLPLLLLLLITACSSNDDTPEQINEEELIDRVVLKITESGTQNTSEYIWDEGSEAPQPIVLNSGSGYDVEVRFYNASNPGNVIDITEEVIEEADEHQIFFETTTTALSISAATSDYEDSLGNKLGVYTHWNASSSTAGTVVVYLIHEPESKSGTDRDALGGETDVQVPFSFAIN
jgi:hypothetical protein